MKPVHGAMALMIAAQALAGPARADVCEDVASMIKTKAPRELGGYWSSDWDGLSAVEVANIDQPPPFTDAERAAMLAEVKALGGNASDVWQSGGLSPNPDEREYFRQRYLELKDSRVGYLENEEGGTAHCMTLAAYYRDKDGHPHPALRTDGRAFTSNGCYAQSSVLARTASGVAWVDINPSQTVPADQIVVWAWDDDRFAYACDIQADYDYRYTIDAFSAQGGTPGNPYKAFMAARFEPWLAAYRVYYDDRPRGLHNEKHQMDAIAGFTTAHPAMAPDLQRLRADITRAYERFDIPVLYGDAPAIIRIEQGWYSTTQRTVGMELWQMKDGKAVRMAELDVMPEPVRLRPLKITRTGAAESQLGLRQ